VEEPRGEPPPARRRISFKQAAELGAAIMVIVGTPLGCALTVMQGNPAAAAWLSRHLRLSPQGLGFLTGLAVSAVVVSAGVWTRARRTRRSATVSAGTGAPAAPTFITTKEEDFLSHLPIPAIRELRVLAHTGKILVTELRCQIDRAARRQDDRLVVKVLLRDPLAEGPSRRKQVVNTYQDLMTFARERQDVQIQVRFYSGLPSVRGIICMGRDPARRWHFLSAYDWGADHAAGDAPGPQKTRALNPGVVWTGRTPDTPAPMKLLEHWFDYLWGPGLLHTIAFDFDDTLLRTHADHVDAWRAALLGALREGLLTREMLAPAVLAVVDDPGRLDDHLAHLYHRLARAPEIAAALVRPDTDAAVTLKLNERRYAQRRAALLPGPGDEQNAFAVRTRAFAGMSEVIGRLLARHYAIYIYTLTDEETVYKALRYLGLVNCVTAVVGRSEYTLQRLQDPDKAVLVHKVAALAGVPTHRVVCIGDLNADMHAADRAEAGFIEARLVEPPRTHLEDPPPADHLYFEAAADLEHVLGRAEAQAAGRFDERLGAIIASLAVPQADAATSED
jgi:phosphoglycolate phosphatase-like HAD superfamily hydrolase